MSQHTFDATTKFITVAGEEEDLYGSAQFAKVARQQHMDIEGMLNNDIIGSSGSGKDRMPHTIRLFSEGVPTVSTAATTSNLQNVGGESDSPARELARYVQEVAQNNATGMTIEQVFRRDRYLRGGDQISFLENGTRPCDSPSRSRTSITSTRHHASFTESNSATWRSSWTSTSTTALPA